VGHRLLPNGRQLRTNAHPLVEMTGMQRQARHRTLVHLDGGFTRARSVRLERDLLVNKVGGP
jgi:hypothetical protein